MFVFISGGKKCYLKFPTNQMKHKLLKSIWHDKITIIKGLTISNKFWSTNTIHNFFGSCFTIQFTNIITSLTWLRWLSSSSMKIKEFSWDVGADCFPRGSCREMSLIWTFLPFPGFIDQYLLQKRGHQLHSLVTW